MESVHNITNSDDQSNFSCLCQNLVATILFLGFSKTFDSIHRGKTEQILQAYGLPRETVTAMMLYNNMKEKVRLLDGDTHFIVAGVLHGDTLAPYLFIIYPDCILGSRWRFLHIKMVALWNLLTISPTSEQSYGRRKWTRRHEFKSWTRLIAFHIALIPLVKVWIQLFSLQLWVNSRTDRVLQPW